jgi:hypothetical protein
MTQWGIPFVLASALEIGSSPVTSDPIDLGAVRDVHAAQFVVSDYTGGGLAAVDVQGSLDGDNWYLVTNIGGGIGGDGTVYGEGTVVARYLQAFAEQFSGSPTASVTITMVSGNS